MKLLKAIRKFERFNFQGVPEGPELSFERDNYTLFSERPTGKSVNTSSIEIDYENAKIIGVIIDDFSNKKETFIKSDE